MLLEKTTVFDASQPGVSQFGLRRGNHRFAERLLQRRHHSVRAGVETGGN